ncbi:MAG: GspE/PulE family protein [Patescibacteria group bacterium]
MTNTQKEWKLELKFEKGFESLSNLKNRILKTTTTEMLELLSGGAISSGASDIHFEPEEKSIRLRFRIDGILEDIMNLNKNDYPTILNRIKLMAGLKINIHNSPQDGRFTIKKENSDSDIEARTSVLPGAYGESVVIRLLDPQTLKKNMEELGMRNELLEEIKKQLKKTTGSILNTGPTGSGKTTTLYAFVNFVNKPGIKIVTIEDPIEYHIGGISQTQVEPDKGYSFANGLRSIIRQDPDVILVGEIRDSETAEIVMHSALTGHLVFSTLHTNDAAGAIPRLIDMGASPQAIAPAINLAIAQRLVRKLCQECKKKIKASPEEIKKIKEVLGKIIQTNESNEIEISKKEGCEKCNFIGYKGRIGVFEGFRVDDELEKLILKSPAVSEIKDLLRKKGMITMLQDSYLKILDGITDFDEVGRILGE